VQPVAAQYRLCKTPLYAQDRFARIGRVSNGCKQRHPVSFHIALVMREILTRINRAATARLRQRPRTGATAGVEMMSQARSRPALPEKPARSKRISTKAAPAILPLDITLLYAAYIERQQGFSDLLGKALLAQDLGLTPK